MRRTWALILALWLTQGVHAQALSSASVNEIVERLAEPPSSLTRGLRNLTPAPRSLDLIIQFDFGSADVQQEGRRLLDNLAAAMTTQRLATQRFRVEGHTDAQGSETYNMALSLRRAQAVTSYLIQHGVSDERLESVGKGFSELLLPHQPQAMENRRVRITALP